MAKPKSKKTVDETVEKDVVENTVPAKETESTTKGAKDEGKDNTKPKAANEESKAKSTQAEEQPTTEADAETPEADTVVEEVEAVVEEPVETVTVNTETRRLDSDEIVDAIGDKGQTLKELAQEKGNYLGLPQALRDAEASQEQIHTPTGTRRTPPMNPFMKLQQEREAKMVKSSVPTAADMAKIIEQRLKVNTADHFVLGSIVAKLNNYVSSMAPNTPVGEELGSRWQDELAKCFFEALAATPDASIIALQIIEQYFIEYRSHAMARSHVFRFMNMVRLDQQRLTAFQSLLHLFVELGSKDGRTKNEIQREINIGKIAESISDNTDAQVRLVEFLN